MKRYKKHILLFLSLSALSILFDIFVLCNPTGSDLVCQGKNYADLDTALLILSLSTFFVLLPLYFLKESVYKTWRKFAIVYIPITIILIFLSPEHSSGFLGPPTREWVTMSLSIFFLILSFIIIVWKTIISRKKKL